MFIGRTDAEAVWPPAKNQLVGKDPASGKDRRWQKGKTEDEIIGWHHRLDGHESEELVMDREAWCAAVMGSQRDGHD